MNNNNYSNDKRRKLDTSGFNQDQRLPQHGGSSQKKCTVPHIWKGGVKGKEHDRNEIGNRYNRHIPGWFDVVHILRDDVVFFPIIDLLANDIAQLFIAGGAKLTISEYGRLTVDALEKKPTCIENEGTLLILVGGELSLNRSLSYNMVNKGLVTNNGSLAFDRPMGKALWQLDGGHFENYGDTLFF